MTDNVDPETNTGSDDEETANDAATERFERTRQAVREADDRARMPDGPPDGAVAQAEDLLIQRDEKGDLIPVWQRIPGTETYALVEPMSNGEAERRLPGTGNALDLEDEDLLDLVKDKVIEPDLTGVESLDDVLAFGLEPLVMCINQASGFEMATGVMSENSELMELMNQIEGNSSPGSSSARRNGSS